MLCHAKFGFQISRVHGNVESFYYVGESSFNKTRGGGRWRYWGGAPKILDTRKGGSEKIRGAPKICIFQNQKEWGGGAPKKLNR